VALSEYFHRTYIKSVPEASATVGSASPQ